jgi:hypothetical protein
MFKGERTLRPLRPLGKPLSKKFLAVWKMDSQNARTLAVLVGLGVLLVLAARLTCDPRWNEPFDDRSSAPLDYSGETQQWLCGRRGGEWTCLAGE